MSRQVGLTVVDLIEILKETRSLSLQTSAYRALHMQSIAHCSPLQRHRQRRQSSCSASDKIAIAAIAVVQERQIRNYATVLGVQAFKQHELD